MMFSPPTGLNQRTDPGASADFFNTIRRFRPFVLLKGDGVDREAYRNDLGLLHT
jgi:hypothetical protein